MEPNPMGKRTARELMIDTNKPFIVLTESFGGDFEEKLNALNKTHKVISISSGGYAKPIPKRIYDQRLAVEITFFHAVLQRRLT